MASTCRPFIGLIRRAGGTSGSLSVVTGDKCLCLHAPGCQLQPFGPKLYVGCLGSMSRHQRIEDDLSRYESD